MPSRSLFLWLPSEAHLRLPPFHEKTFKTFVKLHTISEVIFLVRTMEQKFREIKSKYLNHKLFWSLLLENGGKVLLHIKKTQVKQNFCHEIEEVNGVAAASTSSFTCGAPEEPPPAQVCSRIDPETRPACPQTHILAALTNDDGTVSHSLGIYVLENSAQPVSIT